MLQSDHWWQIIFTIAVFVIVFPIALSSLIQSLKKQTTITCVSTGVIETLVGGGVDRTFTADDCGKIFLLNITSDNNYFIPSIVGWRATFIVMNTYLSNLYIQTSPGSTYSGSLNYFTSGVTGNTIPSAGETQIATCGTPTPSLDDTLNIMVLTPTDTFVYGYSQNLLFSWVSQC